MYYAQQFLLFRKKKFQGNKNPVIEVFHGVGDKRDEVVVEVGGARRREIGAAARIKNKTVAIVVRRRKQSDFLESSVVSLERWLTAGNGSRFGTLTNCNNKERNCRLSRRRRLGARAQLFPIVWQKCSSITVA